MVFWAVESWHKNINKSESVRHFSIATFTSLLLLSSFVGCKNPQHDKPITQSSTEYAKGFRIFKKGTCTEIELMVPFPQGNSPLKYLLVPKNEEIPSHDNQVQVIRTPIDRIVCTSTSHIALLDHLNAIDRLVGFPSTDLISSIKARVRIDAGYVTDLGIDSEINLERLVATQPDMVMGYSLAGEMGQLNKINEFGIPVVINGEYLEDHPLGRAEWIKFMALFLNKEATADSIFNEIKRDYLANQLLARSIEVKPTVMSGILYGDAWFMPGGQNYAAQLFRDAGYHYLWDDDVSNGFLKLSLETVYAKAKNADYWIGVGSFRSKEEMENAEKRYPLFHAFNTANVFTYDARRGVTGGSEYLELGYSRPDLILKDLIKISHPELLPDHQLFFYQKID